MNPARKLWRKVRHSIVPYKTEDGIPITNEPPTHTILLRGDRTVLVNGKPHPDPLTIRPGDRKYPDWMLNNRTLGEVRSDVWRQNDKYVKDPIRSAMIVNTTDKQFVFQGPPLSLVLAPGEKRLIAGPILQRVPRAASLPSAGPDGTFDIVAMDPVRVLEDMVAERQRSIERDGSMSWGVIDRLDKQTLLHRSKIKVFALDEQKAS